MLACAMMSELIRMEAVGVELPLLASARYSVDLCVLRKVKPWKMDTQGPFPEFKC